MKLISMTDFVLEQRMTSEEVNSSSFQQIQNHINTFYDRVFAYANFLKQPLMLAMFFPVDQNGNILSEPEMIEKRLGFDVVEMDYDYAEVEVYKKAKEKVLFDGFVIVYIGANVVSVVNKMDANIAFSKETLKSAINKDIEWLVEYKLPLTESALKQIGLNP